MFFLREHVEGFGALTLKFLYILQAGSKQLTPPACQPLIGALTFKEKSSVFGPIQPVAFQQQLLTKAPISTNCTRGFCCISRSLLGTEWDRLRIWPEHLAQATEQLPEANHCTPLPASARA